MSSRLMISHSSLSTVAGITSRADLIRYRLGAHIARGVSTLIHSNHVHPSQTTYTNSQTKRFKGTCAHVKSLELFSMKDKVCFVTGAARGLGNEFCRKFIEAGCNSLAIIDRKEEDAQLAAEELALSMVEEGVTQADHLDVIGIGCDVSQSQSVKDAFQTTVDRWGKIDAVVAAAGIAEKATALDYSEERFKRMFEINTQGVFYTAREGARCMIENGNGGSIVLVSSMSAGIVNVPQPQSPYNASKAAVKHLAPSLAVEWANKGIRVNSLSPGYMRTRLTKSTLDEDKELKKTWESLTPMGRMGNPEDLKGAILLLASDASKYMTGTDILVDGGYSAI